MTSSADTPNGSEESHWEFAAMAADIPENELIEKTVKGISILLLHHNGQFFAFPPSCPHMEEPLKNGIFDSDEGLITCTKHLWQWDATTGAPIGLAECPLLKYEVKIEGGKLFFNVSKELTYQFS